MGASTSADPGRIFISYRREDSAFPAGWLYDRLCARFGSDYVFKDVDSIDPGDDFLRVIEDAVGSCRVLLALIGDRWLDIADGTGHRRLDDPNDFVRLEIEAALRRDVRVIPILVGRAPLPSSEQLPDSLRGLIRRHAIELSPNRFEPDVGRLVRIIDKTLAAVGEGPADAPAPVDRTSRWQGPPAEGHGNLLADPQWIDAVNAFWAKRWAEAVQRFEALEARYPGEDRVETRLKDARRQRDIDAYSKKSEAAAADGDWDTAVTALENLTALDPGYPDASARLEQARIAQRRTALVDEMTALHQAGRWEAVVAVAQELARVNPDNPDPGGIVSDARAKIRDAELADRYAQALNHLDQEDWQQAADLLVAIEQERSGYRDAAALLTTAQRQRDLASWSDQAATAAAHEDWDTAVPALERICAVDPSYRDAGARLVQARSAIRFRALVDKVTALHQSGRWKEIVAAAVELAQLDPDQPDPGGMVSEARAKLREADAPTSGSPTTTEDLPTAEVQPTDTTPTPPEVSFSQRLNRRTKIVLAVVAACALVAVAVIVIVENRADHQTPDDQTRRLLALVGSDNCSPMQLSNPPAGMVAHVVCNYEGAYPGDDVGYWLFSDLTTLNSYFSGQDFSSSQPCAGMGQSPRDWHVAATPQHVEGKVNCAFLKGIPFVSWTVDRQLVYGSASGPKGGTIQQVYSWWANQYGGGQE